MSQSTRRAIGAVLATVVVVATAASCDGGDQDLESMAPSGSATADPPLGTTLDFGEVTGTMTGATRQKLAADVQEVVDGWIDAAYVGGDYPRTSFSDSWPGFTAGARAEARRDADLTTNRELGARIDGVEATKRKVRLDVLAVKRRPVGVTAHVLLRFATTGDATRKVTVSGRLYLSPGKQGWQVFGYDLAKGDAR